MTLLEKAEAVLSLVYRGKHHIPARVKDCGYYIEVNVYMGMASYDFDHLTRLVVGAHDYCVRVEILSSGPGLLKLRFADRQRMAPNSMESHPRLEPAIALIRD